MVSDFFYPNMGGVENHLFCLSQCLLARGHRVVILTHAYGDRSGVRWLSNGLKVYYLPVLVMYSQCTLPSVVCNLALMRDVFLRERTDVVHGHQAFSSLAHEAIFHAAALGIPAVFTDHSLFGFSDTSSILTNKLLRGTLADAQAVICVSHTSKENTVLRAAISPDRVHVIPNAVVAEQFRPGPARPRPARLTVVVASRLVYRKGIDLLVAVIPRLCQHHPDLDFLIAGDGPKRVDLEQMREKHLLHDRVELLGAVASHEVRNVLVRGDLFLNTSLTEAFCMAIVEAACCGLLVVSTRVGGVPEVLPHDMLLLARPDEEHLYAAVERALATLRAGTLDRAGFHDRVRAMYSWHAVAERTERVYHASCPPAGAPRNCILPRLARLYATGLVYGKILCLLAVLEHLVLQLMEALCPARHMEKAPAFSRARWMALASSEPELLYK